MKILCLSQNKINEMSKRALVKIFLNDLIDVNKNHYAVDIKTGKIFGIVKIKNEFPEKINGGFDYWLNDVEFLENPIKIEMQDGHKIGDVIEIDETIINKQFIEISTNNINGIVEDKIESIENKSVDLIVSDKIGTDNFIEKLDKNKLPATMSNEVLFYDHAILHYRYHKMLGGLDYKNWNQEDFTNYHALIVSELKKRDLPHFPYGDQLDKDSKQFEKKYMIINPSGEKQGERIFLDEVLSYFDSFKMRHPYISLVGGLVIHGSTENDIDILIKDTDTVPENYRHILEWRILRGLPPKLWERVQFHYDKFFGAFTDFVELYDMTIERINLKNNIIRMNFRNFDLTKQAEIRIKPEQQKDAEISLKNDEIRPFRFFYPLKTSIPAFQAYRDNSFYNVDQIIEYLEKLAKRMKLKSEIPEIFIQKKYDGARHTIHKIGDRVLILSEEGSDNTNRFPETVKQVKNIKNANSLVLDAEVELWENNEHQPRENISGYLHLKSPPNDSNIVFNVFDILFLNDQDIHNKSYSFRIEQLKNLKLDQSVIDFPELNKKLNLVPSTIVNTSDSLKTGLKKFVDAGGSEGAMLKLSDSKYSLTGYSTDIFKYKKYVEIDVIVWRVNKTKVSTIFNFNIAAGVVSGQKINAESLVDIGDLKYIDIGKSYNTDLKAKTGDIITISFHTLNYYLNPETNEFRVNLYEPRVIGKSKNKNPFMISDAIRVAKNAGLLQEKFEKDFDFNVINNLVDIDFKKSIDPFMILPPEEIEYRYVIQHHWRGKSLHADLRVESINRESLIGWTINNQISDSIKTPIMNLNQAKRFVDNRYSKINWTNGEWVKRKKTGATELVNAELVSERKSLEPVEWLTVEGEVVAGEVGATKNFPGVFHIVDKGVAYYGAQKLWMHEYFFQTDRGKGGLKGRYFFRQLRAQDIGKEVQLDEVEEIKKITLPASEQEFKDEAVWFFIKPIDQTPYVLSNRAVDQKWIPDQNFSALPLYLKKQIPKEFQYWKKEKISERIEIRDKLVDEIKNQKFNLRIEKFDKLSQSDARFVLQYQTFRKKGKKPIRLGVSRWHFDLRIDTGKNFLLHWISDFNPIETDSIGAYYKRDNDKSLMDAEGYFSPGTELNPTKDTDSNIEIIDRGKCIVLIDEPKFKKIEFRGKKLTGVWIISRSDGGVWSIEKTKPAPEIKGGQKNG